MFKFLTKQPFWVNLLAAFALVFLLGFLFLESLNWLTNHGAYLKVPSVKGKNVDAGIKLLEDQGFEVVIQDSVYFDNIPKYTIIQTVTGTGCYSKSKPYCIFNHKPCVATY